MDHQLRDRKRFRTELHEFALPLSIVRGQQCFSVSVNGLAMAVGTMATFFPNQVAAGLTPVALAILAPIAAVGLIGIGLLLVGWIGHPTRYAHLGTTWDRRPDGSFCGPTTKVLVTILVLFFSFAAALLVLDPRHAATFVTREAVGYSVGCCGGFILYAAWFYDERRHVVTTTYIKLLRSAAFVLVPITWPLLVVFSLDARRRTSDRESAFPDA